MHWGTRQNYFYIKYTCKLHCLCIAHKEHASEKKARKRSITQNNLYTHGCM